MQGWRDTPLNDVGREQMSQLARSLRGRGYDAIYASPLSRAWESAQIVGAALGLVPLADERLREGNRGEWEGRLFAELKQEEAETYAAWRRAQPEFRFPSGESLAEHRQRSLAALSAIAAAHSRPLIVAHRGTLRFMLLAARRLPQAEFHRIDIKNAELVELDRAELARALAAS